MLMKVIPNMQKNFTSLILLLSFASLGLLHATVTMMIDSDSRASVPLVIFLITGPVTVFLYFGGKILGTRFNIGTAFGSNLQFFLIAASCLMLTILPTSIAYNQALKEWGIDALCAVGLAGCATFIASRFISHIVDDGL
ncbi:hypothetical protein D8M19_10300 [Corynebacterium pseudodiphtheriticum]|nr:hypothetical protein D8M19_10300 [Corynebacterium pseudodiphtheriticum]